MPSRDWRLRIQDILQSIDEILQRTSDLEFDDFKANRTVIKAVLYDFCIIGEASRHIPSDVRSRYPQIPWRLMGDMRNIIFHEYFQVELEIVWIAIQNNLPSLVSPLQEILDREASGE
ncbi:MAG: HepT-like ribonuclease domain-containing protein [Microcoleus sp.]